MKYIKLLSLYLSTIIILLLSPINIKIKAEPALSISEEDLKALNLSENETKEFEQFISAINNLPPEEQEFLTKLGQEMEKTMVEDGLDPSNPEDIFKWVDQQQATLPDQEKEEIKPKFEDLQEPATCPKPEITALSTASAVNASTMLKEIIKYLSQFRQKAAASEYMSTNIERFQQELSELTYFLNILTAQDLLKHLTSKDFIPLYQNLDCIHKILATYEPNIKLREADIEIENPYQILGISYRATPAEINKAYKNLKDKFNPEKIAKKLEQQGLNQKEIDRQIKHAKLSFSFIKSAYETLKDPKQKAILDKSLKKQIELEQKLEQSSISAFNQIKNILSNNLFSILSDIRKLLEKYKPEEIAKAKEYEKREKEILAETKRPVRVVPMPPGPFRFKPDDEYSEFYRQLSQIDSQRSQLGLYRPSYYKPDMRSESPFEAPRPSSKKPEDKKAPAKKDEGKKDEKKPDARDGKKDDKDDNGADDETKKDKADQKPVDKAKIDETKFNILALAELLSDAKNEITIEKKVPTKKATKLNTEEAEEKEIDISELEEEPEKKPAKTKKTKIKLDKIAQSISKYLIDEPKEPKKGVTSDDQKEPVKHLKEFFEKNKIKDIWSRAKKLDPKLVTGDISKLWQDKVQKYAKIIAEWYEKLYPVLSIPLRTTNKIYTNKEKMEYYGLGIPENKVKDPEKDVKIPKDIKKKYKYLEDANLAAYRTYIRDLYDIFKNITQATSK